MTSRERVRRAINHQQTDRPPLDLGSTLVTGIHVSAYLRLKKALGVRGGVSRVYDPFQMLGMVEEPVKKALGVDTFGIELPTTIFGYRNEKWKRFRLFDGTEVEISGHFEYDVLPNGDIVQYPRGDRSAPPSGRMPKGGFYFDSIVRQEPIDEARLDPKEWVAQSYSLYTDEELRFLETGLVAGKRPTPEDAARTEARVEAAASAIRRRAFPATPTWMACGQCPFRDICPHTARAPEGDA